MSYYEEDYCNECPMQEDVETLEESYAFLKKQQSVMKSDGFELISQFKDNLANIIENTGVTKGTAQTYLFKFKHNSDKAIQNIQDQYSYSVGMNDKVCIDENSFCLCCLCPVTMSEVEILECEHFICKDCLKCYVESEIKQGSNSVLMKCPQEGCQEKLSYDTICRYANKDVYELFEKFLIEHIVLTSENKLFCPGPDCKNIIKQVKGNKKGWDQKDITCDIQKCRFCFCSLCKGEGHMPLPCDLNTNWLQLIFGVSDNINQIWMKLHTKPCPSCKTNIEKNQGCMHMTCSRCRHEFCWLCLGNWKQHGDNTGGFYSCNIYKNDEEKSQKLNKLEKDFQRFSFFSERFLEHKKSVKISEANFLKKLEELETRNFSKGLSKINSGEMEKFEKSLQVVINARRMIANTYPIAFYIKSGTKRSFFQFLQNELEYQLEKLDKLCTEDLNNFEGDFELSNHINSVWKLSDILIEYANKIIYQLKNNLPDLKEDSESKTDSEGLYVDLSDINTHWSCRACTFSNEHLEIKCIMCDTPKPTD